MSVLNFYLDRALRYGLMSPDEGLEDLRGFLADLEGRATSSRSGRLA